MFVTILFIIFIFLLGIILGCQLHKYLLKRGVDKKLNDLLKERDKYVKED